jgi:hypothetical protein
MAKKTSAAMMCSIVLAALAGCDTPRHRVGQSATVQFGIVRSAEPVTLDSAAAQGAIIGGTLGLIGGRSDSSAVNAIRGATVGGATTAVAEGNRKGMAYTVEISGGSSTRIITDQREIHVGDCVAVERAGETANIRRTSASYCDPANGQAVRAVGPSVESDAVACQGAKQELSQAKSDEAADLATRKIKLLCDD